MHEFFGNPPFFHIGCDEAYDMATCYKCRSRPIGKLLAGHIIHFRDFLKKRGARAIMWHDMLVEEGDPRWDKCMANGHPGTGMGEIYKDLPKDIVIADWEYDERGPLPEGKKPYPTSAFFKENGFDTLCCPYYKISNIKNASAAARENGLFGMMATPWSRVRRSPRWAPPAACCSTRRRTPRGAPTRRNIQIRGRTTAATTTPICARWT